MGAPMARNAARAGLRVRVWNRSFEKAEALADDGVEAADSPAEAVHGAAIVVTMLADGDAVASVMEDGGALAAMAHDAVWCQMSTVGLRATEAFGALAAERGPAYVDAPVLGTRQPAEAADLVVLASGPGDAVARCRELFDAVGTKTLELGDAGAGTRLKLVMNNWVVSLTTVVAETIVLAETLDVDPRRFLDTIASGPLDSGYAQTKGAAMIEGSLSPSFPLTLAAKDAGLILEALNGAASDLAVTRAVAAQLQRADGMGHGGEDLAAVIAAARPG